jgi:hypothetical protein
MFCNEHEPLALLVELTPKLAKKRFRDEIYKSWNHECGYCGEPATSLDHIIPRFKSGSTTRKNLIPACCKCNTSKASSEVEDWFKKQSFFCDEKLNRIKDWMKQEVVDFIGYRIESLNR